MQPDEGIFGFMTFPISTLLLNLSVPVIIVCAFFYKYSYITDFFFSNYPFAEQKEYYNYFY